MTSARSSTAVSRFVLVALVVPGVLTLASLAVQLVVLPQVPATIAIHWGASGQPDGFGPAWTQPLITVLVGFGIPLLLALTSLPGLRRGDRGPSYRLMGAVAAAVAALAAVLFAWTLIAQIGLADAQAAPSVLPAILWGFTAAVAVGVGAWFVQPDEPAHNTTTVPAGGLDLAPGERAVWFGSASMSRAATIGIGATCLAMSTAALVSWFAGAPMAVALILGGVAVLLIVVALTTTTFRVRVDADGLTAVGPAGFPRFAVPLSDVRCVAVTEVNPLGEFGGYGLRWTPGGFGVVLRRGPAIDVTRTSGKRFVVTVEDAARGAALLEAFAQREQRVRR